MDKATISQLKDHLSAYLKEEPTPGLLALLERDPELLVWWETPVECTSAVARREREGALSPGEAVRALERLRTIASGWQEILAAYPSTRTRGASAHRPSMS